jgi:hypothetical protein
VKNLLLISFLFSFFYSYSQPKQLRAVKTSQPVKIDGELDDAAWQSAVPAMDFIQNFPQAGQAASARSEVKILYDDNSIYIGAMLYDDPALIRKQLTARDGEQKSDVDYFAIFLDTYHDKQNGYQFLVTVKNVQTDAKMTPGFQPDFGEYGDKSWDAVWESKTAIVSNGWVAEIRIPYLSLRFAQKDVQDWGLQFLRFIRRNNESSFWNFYDPNVNGFVNQFGGLDGIENLQPPLRLSFSPYVSTGIRHAPQDGGYKNTWLKRGGMDVKYGLNESFTIDATLIPDFGQVVSDNVILNLSPFEVQFQENRPFFTEGTELFNKAGLFYSRRIGGTPAGFYHVQNLADADPNLEIVKNPSVTQLYNATKFSGRNKNKLGIGIFNAVSSAMHAKIRNIYDGNIIRVQTAPLTNYNVFVLDQALRGRSSVTFTNTNVLRDGKARDANVSAIDFSLYNRKNEYALSGTARYSKIFGIKPYDGFNSGLQFKKISGRIQYNAGVDVFSKYYDPNDLGFLLRANKVYYNGTIGYYQFVPKGNFLTYNYTFNLRYYWLYKPYAFTRLEGRASAFFVFRNFWDISLTAGLLPHGENDYFELRTPGRFVKKPAYWFNILRGSTDSRKKLFVSYQYQWGWGRGSGYPFSYYVAAMGFRYRFGQRLTMEISTDVNEEWGQVGYAFAREINGEPIAGRRTFQAVTTLWTGQYNFTSRLNLRFRTRHYWSHVTYRTFHNVSPSTGKLIPRAMNTPIPDPNENFNVFNLDAFLTWDFRLGSRIVAGWKNFLGDNQFIDGVKYPHYFQNLSETMELQHGNEFTIRFIYFLDYNQLKKKK